MNLTPVLLIGVLLAMVLAGSLFRGNERRPGAAWWLAFALVGLIAVLRGYQIVSNFQLWMIYGSMVTLNYIVTFYAAYVLYRDPATDRGQLEELAKLGRKVRIHYVTSVYNETEFIGRCIQSIVDAAQFAQAIAEVEVVVVDDCSTDDTWEKLQQFAAIPGVKLMHLSKNQGKKGGLTAGTLGGENWREAFKLFKERYGRHPDSSDYAELFACLEEVGCTPSDVDLYFHTDSDSIVAEDFIYQMVMSFLSDEKIGSVSGHCDSWVEKGTNYPLMTRLQVAWYYGQFRVRKAAESAFGSVFCVSGPGAGFRTEAIFHVMDKWVDDIFGGKVYRGATDRMLTLLVLQQDWRVVYSEAAKVWTVTPDSFDSARKQWTRWKQNFWRMFVPVWRFAWRVHPIAAFLTYSRLLVTVLAPFLLAYHLVLFALGEWVDSILYLSGIALMGSLMGLVYVSKNPENWSYGLLRPAISLVSAFWGSILTLRALMMTLQGGFVWRDAAKKATRGRFLNRWFIPTFELRFLEAIFVVVLVIYLLRYFGIIGW